MRKTFGNDPYNLFVDIYPKYKITKPIRLIEMFGGYGTFSLGLKYIGANYESYKLVEWAIKSIQAAAQGKSSTSALNMAWRVLSSTLRQVSSRRLYGVRESATA